MTCAELEATIAELPLGTVEAPEHERFQAHARECAPCRARAESLARAYGELRALGDDGEPLPASLRQRIKDRAAEAVRATAERCHRCRETVDAADATYFGLERHAYHVECLAKSREKRPEPAARPALACTFCHDRLERAGAAFCAACLAPHHEECFSEHGRCSAPGCDEVRTVVPSAPAKPRRRATWPFAVLGGATLLVGGAAAFREDLRSGLGFQDAAARQRVTSALRDAASGLAWKKYEEALACYEAALVVDPDNEEARRGAERCRQLLAGGKTAPVAGAAPAKSLGARELAPVVGKSQEEVRAVLGAPVEIDQPADGPTKLTYLKPTAGVFVWQGRVVHAVFYGGWTYHGAKVGASLAEVRDALGVADEERFFSGDRGFIYRRHNLIVVVGAAEGSVTRLVFVDDATLKAIVGGRGWDPDRPEPARFLGK